MNFSADVNRIDSLIDPHVSLCRSFIHAYTTHCNCCKSVFGEIDIFTSPDASF